MSKEVFVVIRDGVVDRVYCSDPEIVVTVLNFGIGENYDYHGFSQYNYPQQEWDDYGIAEVVDEYTQNFGEGENPQYLGGKE